jgi:hypothetical protein
LLPEALEEWESLLRVGHAGRGEVLMRKDGGSTFPAHVLKPLRTEALADLLRRGRASDRA